VIHLSEPGIHPLLKTYIQLLPRFQELLTVDVGISVSDREKFLF